MQKNINLIFEKKITKIQKLLGKFRIKFNKKDKIVIEKKKIKPAFFFLIYVKKITLNINVKIFKIKNKSEIGFRGLNF